MSETKDVLILAIESSCDETAAAVVKNGREVLSNVISSQIALHTLYVAGFKDITHQTVRLTQPETVVGINGDDASGILSTVLQHR